MPINELELLLEHIIKYSFDEIFVIDKDGNVLIASESFMNLFGIKMDEVIGENVYILEEKGVLAPSSITGKVLKTKKMQTDIQQTPMGSKIVVSGFPIFDGDLLIGAVSFSRDITELDYLKQTNEQVAETMDMYAQEIEAMKMNRVINDQVVDDKMNEVFQIIKKVSGLDVTVLLTGEHGVGKNYLARQLHDRSNRKDEPFIEVSCGAIPESLIEAELFGYDEGTFNGAKQDGKKGYFEAAGNGTVYLDEISELSLSLQVKLLSVLQNSAIHRVGSNSVVHLNCRIICSTNQDLKQLVEERKFREELYYRINVINIEIPPLRKRRGEIKKLIADFLVEFNEKYNKKKVLSKSLISWLYRQEWPGNIRELRNFIERLHITSSSNLINIDQAGVTIEEEPEMGLVEYMEMIEKEYIKQMYVKYPSSVRLARKLGISQSTANRKINKYIERG